MFHEIKNGNMLRDLLSLTFVALCLFFVYGLSRFAFTDYAGYLLVLLVLSVFIYCALSIDGFKFVRIDAPFYLSLLFVVYLLIRLDFRYDLSIFFEQICYLVVFICSVQYAYNGGRPLIMGMGALLYLAAFMAKVSYNINETINGFNLWSGFVVFTLLPLICLYFSFFDKYGRILIFAAVLLSSMFLFLVTARVAFFCTAFFYLFFCCFSYLPTALSKSLVFLLVVMSVFLVWVYVAFPDSLVLDILNTHSLSAFNKPIYTGREVIWGELFGYISDSVWLGVCSNCNSSMLESTLMPRNLSSHNTLIEVLYRTGIVGVGLFSAILVYIWRVLCDSNKDLKVSIVAGYLLSSIIFMSSSEYLFSNVFMINLLAWYTFGLGYGFAKRSKSC
ncbi:O-antigen ligase family protein [Neptuniibacter halophilus]|uniref:O-antigen ligase family protein n=1 Tax=Neptuniibacter halophilus TaxID=651666 RepID=UPI00257384C7|nr:O-antigen ligase family protein [Neptuniibacter halophilus]